ncbi:hypothetical protein GCM10011504_42490 [Siccirubricoccus deserti]|nr:hypothetical protein [Siccirubricoccus deserti]GGC59797.1 hypothetical protein GCM10011504_42490 [Siccirubricoccus deserti]
MPRLLAALLLPEYLGRADFARRIALDFESHGQLLQSLGVQPE